MDLVEQVERHRPLIIERAFSASPVSPPPWVDQWIESGSIFSGLSRRVFLQINWHPQRVVDLLVKYPLGSVLRSKEDPDDYGIMLRAQVLNGCEYLWTSTEPTGPLTKRSPSSVDLFSYVDGFTPEVMLALMQPNVGNA